MNLPSVPSRDAAAADGDGDGDADGATVGDAAPDGLWVGAATATDGETTATDDGAMDTGAGDGVEPQAAATTLSAMTKVTAVARRR